MMRSSNFYLFFAQIKLIMSKKLNFTCLIVLFCMTLFAQPKLSYYLPDISYDENITTPEAFLGWQIGEWHVSHDLLSFYVDKLAEESDRITIETYARSHEGRPLKLMTITHPDNHARIDEIREKHIAITDGQNVAFDNLPAVVYQGYSIHGNEPSGSNAAMLVAYYLAAGQSDLVDQTLKDLVILLDPSYNPDGLHRFSSWVNSNRYTNLIYDNQSREFNEPWPRGRTNHYLFDLNRDWLLLTHPESRGRIKNFHKWKPNVLTDHHEMGTNSTFFFQPGIPSRTNPNTPQKNQDLTEDISKFHAAALDEIGSLYYSKKNFDDFYYGKGSTYPDAHGSIGILFEQASSRGHLQESINGVLSFPFTIRNQVKTSLSTQKAAINLKEELLSYKSKFYKDLSERARNNSVKGYVFEDPETSKVSRFIDKLLQHDIDIYQANKNIRKNNMQFTKEDAYVVPLKQKQYTLIKTLFETVHTFNDSLFYDVSAWTMPLAFDINYAELSDRDLSGLIGDKLDAPPAMNLTDKLEKGSYAYIIPWDQYNAPKAMYKLLAEGLRTKTVTAGFETELNGRRYNFCEGSIIVPLHNQSMTAKEIHELLAEIKTNEAIEILPVSSGTIGPIKLGDPGQMSVELPRIALIAGEGTNSYDVGELWHHMDVELNMPFTMLDVRQFSRANLDKYNIILMADGSYRSGIQAEKLKKWIEGGGTLISFKSAIDYLSRQKIIKVNKRGADFKSQDVTDYNSISSSNGAQRIGGSIFNTRITKGHPLAYGYADEEIPLLKRGTRVYTLESNRLAVPAVYTNNPLLSGYSSDENLNNIKNTAAIMVHGVGSGKVISFVDNILFRGYWFGGHRLFANAIFYNDLINGSSLARAE